MQSLLEPWHRLVENRDLKGLDSLLADNVVMHSPALHKPLTGKPIVTRYLTAALHVIANDTFHYVREVVDGNDAVLEFECTMNGVHINGVDMIRFDDSGRIIDFKVMIRPWKALETLKAMMAEGLDALS